MQRTLYIIATTSRSGSTHLCRMLASTRRLGEPTEYYNVRVKPERMKLYSAASDAEYFQEVLWRTSTDNGVCGIKVATLAFAHLRRELGPIFELLRPKYIWLRRRDMLRQAISLYRAAATDIWHWHAGQPRPSACPLFDADRIAECRRQIEQANEQWAAWFAEREVKPLELWYEEVVAQPLETIRAVCRHVGVDANGLPRPASDLCVMRDDVTEQWLARLDE